MLNWALKKAIHDKRLFQKQVARRAKIDAGRMSSIVNGRWVASDDEQQRIAKVLDMPVSALFEQAGV